MTHYTTRRAKVSRATDILLSSRGVTAVVHTHHGLMRGRMALFLTGDEVLHHALLRHHAADQELK